MAELLNLSKGEKVDLTKTNPGVDVFKVGLGWDVNKGNGSAFDLDAFIVPLGPDGKAITSETCYYGRLKTLNEGLSHSGDNLTGAGDGEDEVITVTMSKLPQNVDKLVIAVNIYEAASRRQNFGQVRNAFVQVRNGGNNQPLMRYDLGEEYSTFQGVAFGELYRHNGEWKFAALSNGFNGTINDLLAMY